MRHSARSTIERSPDGVWAYISDIVGNYEEWLLHTGAFMPLSKREWVERKNEGLGSQWKGEAEDGQSLCFECIEWEENRLQTWQSIEVTNPPTTTEGQPLDYSLWYSFELEPVEREDGLFSTELVFTMDCEIPSLVKDRYGCLPLALLAVIAEHFILRPKNHLEEVVEKSLEDLSIVLDTG